MLATINSSIGKTSETSSRGSFVQSCHGPCSVTFFPKNNQRTAPTEPPMMAASPLFSATIITGHLHWTYIGAPSEYFLHSDTTNKTCIPIIAITNQHHVLSTAAQPEPHHAPHMFHVPGQSHRACTSSRSHESWSPQGLARIYVGIPQHPPEYNTAGAGWCFPWKNPFLDTFCDFQRFFPQKHKKCF